MEFSSASKTKADRWSDWSREDKLDQTFNHFRRFQGSLGIELTMRCPLKCGHCSYSSGPERMETVDPSVVGFVEQAIEAGTVKLLIISGGEPMLERKLLNDVASVARRNDVAVAVNTSAYWGRNLRSAKRFLSGFPDITHLNISVDEYHEDFVPITHARTATRVALELGLIVTLMPRVWDLSDDPYLDRIESVFGADLLDRIAVDLQSIHIDGRGKTLPEAASKLPLFRTDYPKGACRFANQATVNTCGTVKACCNHNVAMASKPLQLGNSLTDSYQTIASRTNNSRLFQAVRTWGPARLAQMLDNTGHGDALKGRYPENDICSLCEDIMTQPPLVAALDNMLADPAVFSELYVSRLLQQGETFDEAPCDSEVSANAL